MKQNKRILSAVMALAMTFSVFSGNVSAGTAASDATKAESASTGFADYIKNTANRFIVVKTKQMGGSHYAYTDGVSDSRERYDQPNGDEYQFTEVRGGEMVLLEYDENDPSKKTETSLLGTTTGVIRDPDVSPDGTKVLYSYKANENDDYHLYEMNIDDALAAVKAGKKPETTQLTFGQGISDTECKYLPNGKIIFSSTRAIQTVDCWKIAVSNLYTCDADGKNILRLGYDQVHTTYPTVTEDGRVLYTRWDYNDRNQMFIQGVFQMFPDGTNQTELYGNNTDFPTTLVHTVEVPGQPGQYYSIATGHHTMQAGKLCLIDTTKDRNDYIGDNDKALTFIDTEHSHATYEQHYDTYGQSGYVYKYPVGISQNELFVSISKNGSARSAQFGIYYMYIGDDGKCETTLVSNYSSKYRAGASQIAPIPKTESHDFERPTMVNYSKDTGTYYVGNVYEGEAVKDLKKPKYNPDGTVKEAGEVAALRVVELDFRASAIGRTWQEDPGGGSADPFTPIATGRGSWDVKQILGIVDVEADGSALFEVPSETPVYFQLLNEDGEVLQTMRSWSTLMPGETFSCVGCHENKNSVPPSSATVSLAMKKGVQKLKNESWMDQEGNDYEGYNAYEDEGIGFSYMSQVQPIFDKSCVSCHNNTDVTMEKIGYTLDSVNIFESRSEWSYKTSGDEFETAHAPFGSTEKNAQNINTVVNEDSVTIKKTFNVTSFQKERYDIVFDATFTGTIASAKLNDQAITIENGQNLLDETKLNNGENTIEITVNKGSDGLYFDAYAEASDVTSLKWYKDEYDISSWKTGGNGFGSAGSNGYNSDDIAIRNTFNLTQSQIDNIKLEIDIFYDEDPLVYINGKRVYSTTGYYDKGYQTYDITSAAKSVLREGENIIGVSATNNTGGKGLDLALKVNGSYVINRKAANWKYYDGIPPIQGESGVIESDQPFSLEAIMIGSGSTRKEFPSSYLFLTDSTKVTGDVIGAPRGQATYVKWLSSMSTAEIQQEKSFGSIVSPIVTTLQNNHKNLLSGGKITEDDIKTIAAWIDLCVPVCGSYDENNIWNGNEVREWEEKENKRAYYDDMNDASRAVLSNTVEDNGELTISYNSDGVVLASETGTGTVQLNVASDLKVGDLVSIKLPEGEKYVAFRLDPRFEEAIIYCPTGTFNYIVPEDAKKVFPRILQQDEGVRFFNLTMAARIPSEDELKQTRNLALNPYDLTNDYVAYPHVTTSTNCNNAAEFAGRNAIDGFTSNQGHGEYPYQSWGPELGDNQWFKIDFGREVTVDKVVVYTRADFDHDSHYLTGTLKFSDGSTQPVNFYRTKDAIEFELETPVDTTSVEIKDLIVDGYANGDPWAGFTEVEVYGSENLDSSGGEESVPATGIELNRESDNLSLGNEVQLTATVKPDNASNKQVTWSTSDPNVASVTMSGKVTATGNGTATITATTHNGLTDTYTVTIATKATSIAVSPTTVSNCEVGGTVQLTATVKPDATMNKAVTWKSSDPTVASVDENGLVTFLKGGTALITATTTDGTNLTSMPCRITVNSDEPAITSISVSPATASVYVGSSTTLKAVANTGAAMTASWSSSNTGVATVDANGVVRGVRAGTAVITATAGGFTATATVTVVNRPASTVTNGTKVVNGKTVLYSNGKAVTGTRTATVGGKTYAVVKGYVSTGRRTHTVKIGSRTYVVNKYGIVQKGKKNKLVKVSSSKWYIVNKSGVVQKGKKNKLVRVGTKSYIVNKNGVVQKGKKNKLVKIGNKSYIVNKSGVVQKGKKNKLVKIGKKSYIVNKSGIVQKNKKSIKAGKKTYKTNKTGIAKLR